MELTLTASPGHSTGRRCPSPAARSAASCNLRKNLAALCRTQSALATEFDDVSAESLEWVFARDNSLTIRDADGWWGGCSLPGRASVKQLETLDAKGPVSCFLDPPHAAYLRVVLGMTKRSQAVIALTPDDRSLAILLGAADLSEEIAAHRIWFAAGHAWPMQLRDLFRQNPGLATPTQFIRLTLPDADRLDPVIATAREILAEIASDRASLARRLHAEWDTDHDAAAPGSTGRDTPRSVPDVVNQAEYCENNVSRRPDGRKVCVVTGSEFRLWEDASLALARICEGDAAGNRVSQVNCDDPTSASTVELLRRAVECDALLTADIGRCDLPDLLPPSLPWITWVTSPRVPKSSGAGPNDRLLVADPAWIEHALAGGWGRAAVEIGGWPAESTPSRNEASAGPIAAILDTRSLESPPRLDEFSSNRLFWNAIRDELLADPHAAGTDADAYLTSRQKRFGLVEAPLDRNLFLHGLIDPAIAQGMVRRLIAQNVPLRLHGAGWSDIAEFSAIAGGPVRSHERLLQAAAEARALLDLRPVAFRNGLYVLGRPVIRCCGRTRLSVRQEITAALAGGGKLPAALPAISVSSVLERLPAMC